MKKFLPALIAIICCAFAPLIIAALIAASRHAFTPANQKQAAVGLEVGNQAPSFEFVSTDGTSVKSADLRGKVVVLVSAAAWCQSCAVEALKLARVYPKYNERVAFLTVDIDPRDSAEVIDKFRSDNGTPWPYANAAAAANLIRDYRLNRLEMTYVIDQQGIMRFNDIRIMEPADLEGPLNTLL